MRKYKYINDRGKFVSNDYFPFIFVDESIKPIVSPGTYPNVRGLYYGDNTPCHIRPV